MCNFGSLLLLLCLLTFNKVGCDNCRFGVTVDISDGVRRGQNFIHDNVTYPEDAYFESNGKVRGCLCTAKPCIPKCCPHGQLLVNKTCVVNDLEFLISAHDGDIPVPVSENHFHVLHNRMCSGQKIKFDPLDSEYDQFFVQTNGDIFMPYIQNFSHADPFCLEQLADNEDNVTVVALVCYTEEKEQMLFVGMIISMPFLLVTFIVYALIPERNLPAKALMCYVLSLLFAYIFLVTIQLHSSFEPFACATVGLLCYFFFMVSFFWMNSSCIDIWLTFSGIRGLTGSKKRDTRRFLYYSAYAWGVPLLLVCLVIGLSYGPSVDVKSLYHPGLGNGQCWFGSGMPTFLYFYLPIAILLTTNIVLFCVTAYKIQMVRNDTAMLRRDDSQKSRLESDKQRFNLYVKLLLAMGINWTMEVISWALNWKFSNIPDEVWYLTDFCNALYGVFIFFIFVFKRNIWIMLKKRYLTFTGKPHLAHSLGTSTTRTTVSHVTSEA